MKCLTIEAGDGIEPAGEIGVLGRTEPLDAAGRRTLHALAEAAVTESVIEANGRKRARLAWLAILLVAPAASVGVIGGQLMQGTGAPALPWVLSKAYVIGVMLWWHVRIDRGKLHRITPRPGAYRAAIGIGIAIGAVIVGAYVMLAKDWMDGAQVVAHASRYGLDKPLVFVGAALYWIVGNAALEEFTFRWFVFRQSERVMPVWVAVFVSSGAFTAHHALALMNFADGKTIVLASAGVFAGGLIWSGLYLMYRSLLVVWVCHAIVDVAVFSLAGYLIFLA